MRRTLPYQVALFLLSACTPAHQDPQPIMAPQPSAAVHVSDTALAYRAAIAEYIRAMNKRDGSFSDALYIGRHDEFPGIDLPAIIENTPIRIVTPAEAEVVKDGEHFTYLNIFGWFSGDRVEFLVVNFKQHMHHRPDGHDDCHLYYSMSTEGKELALDSLRF